MTPIDGAVDRLVEDEERRYLVDRWYPALAALLVIVAVLAGYVAVSEHQEPSTVTEQEVASEWTVSTSWSHAADVDRTTVLHREGERLMNQPLYFTNVSSTLHLTHQVQHLGDDAEPANVDVDFTQYLRARDGDDVYWQEMENLGMEMYSSVASGDLAESEIEVDVAAAEERIQQIEADLGASPGTAEVAVEADVSVSSEVAGENVDVEMTDRARTAPAGATFSVATESGEESETVLQEVTYPADRSITSLYLSPILALLALFGLYALERSRRRGAFDLTEDVQQRLRFERQREDLDEWISRGNVPEGGTRIELESLEDVVDVAIDSDRRVIETRGEDGREFVVVVDTMRYFYRPEFDGVEQH